MAFSSRFTLWVFVSLSLNPFFRSLMAEEDFTTLKPLQNGSETSSSAPLSSHMDRRKSEVDAFRPSIAVIVAVLATIFTITFLFLLYARHCKSGSNSLNQDSGFPASGLGRNSGVDPVVIDSLPVFRFGSLHGLKERLECAVCLSRFEPAEVLRLLPKCRHAFHVECVDTWLDSHSTCPLCRTRVDPEDVLLIENEPDRGEAGLNKKSAADPDPYSGTGSEPRRISGRHSSAGEKSSGGHLHLIFRRSVDGGNRTKPLPGVGAVNLGCLERAKKAADRERFEHRIVVSDADPLHPHPRWSDSGTSDLLYLRSEMIISERERSTLSRPRASCSAAAQKNQRRRDEIWVRISDEIERSGRTVINSRCLSEISGLNRNSPPGIAATCTIEGGRY